MDCLLSNVHFYSFGIFIIYYAFFSYSLLFPFIVSFHLLWIFVIYYSLFLSKPHPSLSRYSLHSIRQSTSSNYTFPPFRPRSPLVSPAEQLSEVRQGPPGYVGTLLLRPSAGWAHLHVLPLRGDGGECPRALRSCGRRCFCSFVFVFCSGREGGGSGGVGHYGVCVLFASY